MELSEIKGLGKKRVETLNDKGIFSLEDLLFCFPKTYYDLNSKNTFQEDGKYKLLYCKVISAVKIVRIRKNFTYSFCECLDIDESKFKAIWYNQPYIKNAIKEEDELFLYGKNSVTKHGYFVVSNFRNKNKINKCLGFLPVYKTSKNIGQSVMISAVKEALTKCKIPSVIPRDYELKNNILEVNQAINVIHFPESEEELKEAKERLDIEKLLPVIKINDELKNSKNMQKGKHFVGFSTILNDFCSFLPYSLSQYQLKVLSDIENDFKKSTIMNRLIQGDVGSGKTIVALISLAVCLKNGYSGVFIAPTQILALQHYEEAKKYFSKLNLEVLFMCSNTSAKDKKNIINKINSGKPVLVIGTHACLNDEIDTNNIGLIVIDEQHRFGVNQRAFFVKKSKGINLLMLSATPIPRSLSLVYYGGLDISILSKPPKEKHIQTNIVSPQKEEDMWNFIEGKINKGSKVYVVCSNIDDSDDDSYQGLSVKSVYQSLCDRFSKNTVLMAHGKLDNETENKTLNEFKNGNYKILVSTTIVEVGVDIKEADIMVIVSPEKFGLASLHQLRGRIGRAGQQAYCFCLANNLTDKSFERIKYFRDHLDGFDIAEYDYKSRGAGNILGTQQHGKIENIFDFVSLETYNKAKKIYEEIGEKINLESNKIYQRLSSIALN